MLRTAIALNETIARTAEASAPAPAVPVVNRIAFTRGGDRSAATIEALGAGALLTPGLVLNFENDHGVVASCRPDGLGEETEREALAISVADAGSSRWLSLEFLIDAAKVRDLGLIALTVRIACRPAVRISTLFRVFKGPDASVDFPGFGRAIGEDTRPLVDGIEIPADVRAEMDPAIPCRYIVLLPLAACDLTLEEAVIYPALAG